MDTNAKVTNLPNAAVNHDGNNRRLNLPLQRFLKGEALKEQRANE
jgi:hypothetical protein